MVVERLSLENIGENPGRNVMRTGRIERLALLFHFILLLRQLFKPFLSCQFLYPRCLPNYASNPVPFYRDREEKGVVEVTVDPPKNCPQEFAILWNEQIAGMTKQPARGIVTEPAPGTFRSGPCETALPIQEFVRCPNRRTRSLDPRSTSSPLHLLGNMRKNRGITSTGRDRA